MAITVIMIRKKLKMINSLDSKRIVSALDRPCSVPLVPLEGRVLVRMVPP